MTEGRITRTDLDWWLEFAAEHKWTFAKTYASSAPHHYIVQDRTLGVGYDDVVRAARVIHTFGMPGKYYSMTKIYLASPDGQYRWWTEDRPFTDATLVNRATTQRSYGIQNASATASGIQTPYDEVATIWDVDHPAGNDDAEHLRQLLTGSLGKYPPHILDIGCGTGRLLDLGLVTPDRYAGVDRSQAMLNTLIRKYPRVAAIYPADIRHLLAAVAFTPGQFDWVFLDSTVELTDRQLREVDQLARLATITVHGGEWRVQIMGESSVEPVLVGGAR
jgi:SAM-dependent methyltransferase